MENDDTLVFFEASENITTGNHDKYSLPWEEFFEWYKTESDVIKFSNSFYFRIFESVPEVYNVVMSEILDDQSDRRTMNGNKVQFSFSPYVATELIRLIKNQKNLNVEEADISKFIKMLENVAYKKMIVWGEYTVRNGWFDFEQVMKEKRSFKDSLGL